MHLEAGLLHSQGKQNFTSQPTSANEQELSDSAADHLDIGDSDDLLDFHQLSEHLIVGVATANGDKDVGNGDDGELPPTAPGVLAPPLTITIPPLNLANLSNQATEVQKTFIPLQNLFKYPTVMDPPSDGMNSFWKGGIQNLEKEIEAYEILSSLLSRGDGDGTNLEIPAMQVYSGVL